MSCRAWRELGILGICLPVRYGGQGMDYITLGLACEELEVVDYDPAGGHVGAHGAEQPGAAAVGHAKSRSSAFWCRRRKAKRSPALG